MNDARDVLWAFHAPEQYQLLVLERGWTTKRYARFLADGLTALLVGAPASVRRRQDCGEHDQHGEERSFGDRAPGSRATETFPTLD